MYYYKDPHNVIFLDIVHVTGMIWRVISYKFPDVSELLTASIIWVRIVTPFYVPCAKREKIIALSDAWKLAVCDGQTDCRQREGHSIPFQGHHVLAGSRLRSGCRRDTPSTGGPHQM
jgi:hypothetical protein